MNNPQVICIIGLKTTGKTQVCNKLKNDFRYYYIDASGLPESSDIVHDIIEDIQKSGRDRVLIEGFPKNKLEAIQFQTQFCPIQKIIKLNCEEQALIKRVSKKSSVSEDEASNLLRKTSQPVEDINAFYQPFGNITEIDGTKDADDVYEAVKKAIQPRIIYLYGPPRTGKTTVAKILAQKIDYKFVSFEDGVRGTNPQERIDLLNHFTSKLRYSNESFMVVDDFPQTKEQYEILVNQLGQPYRVFSLEANKDQVERQIRNFSKQSQIKTLNKTYNGFMETRPTIQQLFKDNKNFVKINALQPIEDIVRDIINNLKPQVIGTYYTTPQEQLFMRVLERKNGWKRVDAGQIINGHVERKTSAGSEIVKLKQASKAIEPKNKLEAMKHILFRSNFNKILLLGMGQNMKLYDAFEKELFPVQLFEIELEKSKFFRSDDHPIIDFIQRGDYIRITDNVPQLFEDRIEKGNDYGIVFGAPASGKTTLSRSLSKAQDFVLVEWEPTLNTIKQKYCSQEEKALEEVPFSKTLKYFKDLFAANPNKTVLFDGFQPEKNLSAFLKEFGKPRYLIHLNVDKPVLIRRTRIKNQSDVNAEVGEEENQKIQGSLQKAAGYAKLSKELLQSHPTIQVINVDSNGALNASLSFLDNLLSRNIFVVHQEEGEENPIFVTSLQVLFKNICVFNEIAYIDVSRIIRDAFEKKGSKFHKELEDQYQMRSSKQKYDWAGHYQPSTIISLIYDHLARTNQRQRDIMLYNYPASSQQEQSYPRPSDQLAAVENNLGNVRVVVYISKNELNLDVEEKKMVLQRPPEPVKQKKEGEAEPPAEEKLADEAKKEQFSIYDYEWSAASNVSRSLGQWYCSLKPNTEKVTYQSKTQQDRQLFDNFDKILKSVHQDNSKNFIVHLHRHY